jgi:hypothetical protein
MNKFFQERGAVHKIKLHIQRTRLDHYRHNRSFIGRTVDFSLDL